MEEKNKEHDSEKESKTEEHQLEKEHNQGNEQGQEKEHNSEKAHKAGKAGQEHKSRAAHKPKRKHSSEHSSKEGHKKKDNHKKSDSKKKYWKKLKYFNYVLGALVVIMIIIFVAKAYLKPAATGTEDLEKFGKINVTFFVMSQCPYGIQVENAIGPVLKELGSNINFRLEFIAAQAGEGFQSLHGQPEVAGDIIQLCVQELYPDKLIDFVVCQNKDPRDLEGTAGKCAQSAGIPEPAKITECSKGVKGKELMIQSIMKSRSAGAQGSPTIYIGAEQYGGARDTNSFRRAICSKLNGHPACENMPACSSDTDCMNQPGKIGLCENPGKKDAKCNYQDDARVELIIVNSKDCPNCNTAQFIQVLQRMFYNMDVKEADASSETGSRMISRLNLQHAPSLVFGSTIQETYAWKTNERLRTAFRQQGDYFVMLDEATGATFVLDAEKRKEIEKLTGVEKGDNKPQIDFYVMSYCPYGNMAEEAIEPVYKLLGDKADFNPHYVIYSNYNGGGAQYCIDPESKYCSMHGVQEMRQGLRELCVDKHIGIKEYFRFVLEMNKKCNYQNADSCWENVAKGLGLDVVKIKSCEANEWDSILSKELALNQALGVRGSPTVFVEGAEYGGDRSPAGYGESICAGFDTKPAECSSERISALGGSTAPPAAAAGGCG
jgi:glutaredoxin